MRDYDREEKELIEALKERERILTVEAPKHNFGESDIKTMAR